MKRVWAVVLTAMLTVGMAAFAQADLLLDAAGEVGPNPESTVEGFPFDVAKPKTKLVIEISATLAEGEATFRVLDPSGKEVFRKAGGGRLTFSSRKVPGRRGRFQLEVSTEAAVGKWNARIFELPKPSALRVFLVTGPAMILVALGSVIYWKRRSRTRLRWFWVGAGVWTAGVALKFTWAAIFYKPILEGLERILPRVSYVVAGGMYVGLLTGVFEIGVTLAAVYLWRRMASDANRAVAVGVGAGAFEALLLGLAVFTGLLVALSGKPGAEPALAATAGAALVTPLAWMVGPVERIIAILCHTSSRTLVLFSVASRRWSFFWWGFMIMTAIDAIAGFAHVGGAIGHLSLWWIELAIAPFALASVPIIRWCLRHWPDEHASVGGESSQAESSNGTV